VLALSCGGRWKAEGAKKKQPYYVSFGDSDDNSDVMAFAGLYDVW
jgi:putative SOS response-associated peptidase YedK